MTTIDAIHNFEDAYTRWALARKNGRLTIMDQEPDGKSMGLDEWTVKQIKARVEREIYR
jgi:hypothetical protein